MDRVSITSESKDNTEQEFSDSARQREIQRIYWQPRFTIRHTASEACDFQPHSHSAFTVTAILAGRLRATIATSEFDLLAGQVAFTNPNENHSAISSGVEFVSVSISPVLINELISETGLTSADADIIFQSNTVQDEAIIRIVRALAEEIASRRTGHEAMLDAMVRQLTIHLLRSHLTVRKPARIELSRAGPVDRRLRRAIEFMHDNFSRELALEEIAAAAYLSEYHFARLFKQITGVTPHVYLANLRIERARKMLAETAMPIIEIAATVGYQSQSHFTKIFKSITGFTPRAYRESSK